LWRFRNLSARQPTEADAVSGNPLSEEGTVAPQQVGETDPELKLRS
jgi:hypothetical protein